MGYQSSFLYIAVTFQFSAFSFQFSHYLTNSTLCSCSPRRLDTVRI